MDNLARAIDAAVPANDYNVILNIFSDQNNSNNNNAVQSWHSVGQGEQRSIASHFICAIVTSTTFLPKAFENENIVNVMITTLGHLPSTVPNAADNTLRQQLFDYKVNTENDYAGAARILAGMRMEDDTNSVYYMTPAAKCDGKKKNKNE